MTDQHNTPDEATEPESKVEHPLRAGAVPSSTPVHDLSPLELLKRAYDDRSGR